MDRLENMKIYILIDGWIIRQIIQINFQPKFLKNGFEPADGGLAENIAVEGAEGQADVRLGEAQLDPPLLKLLGERLEVI